MAQPSHPQRTSQPDDTAIATATLMSIPFTSTLGRLVA
jgi:hypothetical protein